jgi:hypothetical protein
MKNWNKISGVLDVFALLVIAAVCFSAITFMVRSIVRELRCDIFAIVLIAAATGWLVLRFGFGIPKR